MISDVINKSQARNKEKTESTTGIEPVTFRTPVACSNRVKSDERNIPGNYRAVSILPAISKIVERVMHTQLLEYFHAGNYLLTEFQSGFRPNHSKSTAFDKCSKPLACQHGCW